MYIILAIIVFGILIATHELGHFTVAKLCGVKVNEFAIGMGPTLFKKQGKETLYSLRLLPIGGFCAMEGEDEDTGDERAFSVQRKWKKLLILAAGAFMNFLFGFIIVVILFMSAKSFVGTTITELADGFPYGGESGIMVGDEIVSINGYRTYYSSDFSTFMSMDSDGVVDMVIKRDGQKIKLDNFELKQREYIDDGVSVVRYGITFNLISGTLGHKLEYSCYTTWNFIRLIWISLVDLVRGAVGFKDLSGVVGIVSTVNEVGQSAPTVAYAIQDIAYLFSFIAINLAVMNMLPIPALDGGRIFFMIITAVVEKIIGRKVNPKYEGYIHSAGLFLLMGLMAVVMISDVVKLFHG
jgi:regulator of sigma E protease